MAKGWHHTQIRAMTGKFYGVGPGLVANNPG